jgi:hypothetical protein
MGQVRLAEAMTASGRGQGQSSRLDGKPSGAFEALRLVIMQAGNGAETATAREDEIAEAIEQIRGAAALRKSSEQHIGELEAALEAVREGARRDLGLVEHRAEQAEARAMAEAERAASAERRLQLAEGRLDQIIRAIEGELKPRNNQGARTPE